MFSRTLVEGLNGLGDRPWSGLRKGKGMDDRSLAKQLGAYGIHPRTVRIEERTCRGHERGDFKETFQRYVPAADTDNTDEMNPCNPWLKTLAELRELDRW
jgi:hypothetical protein